MVQQSIGVTRRATLVGGAATVLVLPCVARAQQAVRRVGLLMGIVNDAEGQARVAAFRRRLQGLGWEEGRNIRFEYRWGADNIPDDAAQLVASQPDIVLANTTLSAAAMKNTPGATPTVFVMVADPVGAGLVASLAHPGGSMTGFTSFEPAMGGKWLQILREIASAVTRVAIVHNPADPNWPGFKGNIESTASLSDVRVIFVPVRQLADIAPAIEDFAREPNGGLVLPPTPLTSSQNRKLITALAAKHGLPAIYPFRFQVADGGLVSYGFDSIDPFRLAADYVDRILKGEKPADLPVQAPTKYELAVNLKTAKAIGLAIPESFLLRADEVIE